MDKELKSRSGSVSNRSDKSENRGDKHKTSQPGATQKSNRQTKGHDESFETKDTGTKKGPDSI